jgi:hypothetical protein
MFEKINPIKQNLIEDLQKIVKLIFKEENWTQKALARDINDIQIFDPYDEKAVKFCVLGAAYRIEADKNTFTYLERISKRNGFSSIDSLNDKNKHEEIMFFLLACLKFLGYNEKKFRKELK